MPAVEALSSAAGFATIQRVGLEAGPKRGYTRAEVCRMLGVSETVLAGWEQHGFVERGEEYAFADLIALRTLLEWRKSRIRPQRIRQALEGLRSKIQGVRNPLTELKIYADGGKLAVRMGGSRMEAATGQLLLDFDREEMQRLLTMPGRAGDSDRAAKRHEAERWFEKGLHLEQSGAAPESILPAYFKAAELDPDNAAVHVNLGTIYYHMKKWEESREHYRKAVEIKPDYPLAHFNLGNLCDELGDWAQALEHYLATLRLEPEYADAHYNLALLYQSHGEPLKAVRHWRSYLKLDPAGYWAGIARRELGKLRDEAVVPSAGN